MFGTFQPEEEKPTYGITKPINSWNAVFANVSHYVEMGKDLRRIPSWTDKIKYLFKKPGWLPQSLGGYRPAPEVDKLSYKKYDTPAPMSLNLYVLVQYILCLIATAIFLNKADQFSLGEKFFVTALICIVVVNSGVLFEQRTWAKYSEWIRIIVYPLLLTVLTYMNSWSSLLYILAGAYFIISITWFYTIQRRNVYIQMV